MMKGNEQMKTLSNIVYGAFALLASFALLPEAQAVVPAPDGGYPGQNTAKGRMHSLALRPAPPIRPTVMRR